MASKTKEGWQVRPVYQPIVALGTGGVVGYEALARGVASDGTLELPRALFGRAERVGKLRELDLACWRAAIGGVAAGMLADGSPVRLFVNVMPDTLVAPGFEEWALGVLAEHGVPPTRVVLELSEGRRIGSYARVREAVERFRALGFRFAIDDAGTGHSGLQALAELRPDLVKIDRSLVRRVDRDEARSAILELFVALADRLGTRLVAEGIETAGEIRALAALGVELGQGHYLARPVEDPIAAVHENRVAARLANAGVVVLNGRRGAAESEMPGARGRVVGA